MTTVQIILLSMIAVCLLFSVIFMILFILEVCKHKQTEENEVKEEPIQSVFTINNYNITTEEKEESSVSDMLASLEEQTKNETPVEEESVPVIEEVEPVAEPVVETVEEPVQIIAEPEPQVVENEVVEEETEDTEEEIEEPEEEPVPQVFANKEDELFNDINEVKSMGREIIRTGNLIDYKNRLEKVIETRDKIDRDLTKRQKSILKYERTKRRMNRNQKMLDRRAGELTNLNLVMYSVTDIKNIDEDKKAKQEDLTAHIAELKASIQDAEEYIESNKDKNDNNIRMAKYLLNEKNRFNEEIVELEALIKSIEGNTTDTQA